ncbi:cytochrome c [Aquabacterium sp. A7-Y]|uniref:SorU family sulfite dehydrogenase c-type cytochrome subunit n=1 Tax=Aquabacterium sp. A7-Y TaxID=1349605 RepID=UPI00223E5A90|nr:cytochrome c [Aquabacterium sp. A7-Y]MCW7542108.1 cytochrome c [Aquabacterium sp. A7-Y]
MRALIRLSRGWHRASLALLASAALLPAARADEAAQLALGRKLFTETAVPACKLCHTLKDAGAEGAVGPVLDELKPDAQRVATALRNGLGAMPSYRASLSDEQIAALARYVAKASGAAP